MFGFARLAFASWLLVELLITLRQLAMDPMMVPSLGPALFMSLGDALLIFTALPLDPDEIVALKGKTDSGLRTDDYLD